MATLVERVILLEGVDVFSDVPTEQLAQLAAIAEEVTHPPGACIYAERDPSDAMYIVLSGQVRLHRGVAPVSFAEREVAFGTWALFDDELRVVSATAVDEVQLLRIDKEEFLELLADNVEVTRGILKTLAGRLRLLAERVGGGGSASVS
jgi:CRP-like cAMP-binding protein